MDILSTLGIFIIFPFGAALIGILYLRLYAKQKNLSSLLTAGLWLLYAVYEYLMYTRILCTGECNIRIDLVLIYPVMIALSFTSTILYYRQKAKRQAKP